MFNKNLFIFLLIGILLPSIEACTGILLKTTTNSPIYARTLEFRQDLGSQVMTVPQGVNYTAPTPNKSITGLAWKTKYAALGANAFKAPYFVDGVNEKGLAGGFFYFAGFAEYQDVATKDFNRSLPFWMLLTWILTTCQTVQDVKDQLSKIYISKTNFSDAHQDPPAHLIVHDLAGNSIVIEYIKGVLTIHDNPIGVITNAPSFDWHMTNIRNYINLSPLNTQPKIIGKVRFEPLGQGSGMLGLPGDSTPPSRFIRAVYLSQAAPKLAHESEAINHAFHILNNFDIPKGAIVDEAGLYDHTTWTSAIDMKGRTFYYKTYDNPTIKKVSLSESKKGLKKIKTVDFNS